MKQVRALIVEDDRRVRDLAVETLRAAGVHDVVAVGSRDAGCRAWDESFDLVLLDNNFPKFDGAFPEPLGLFVAGWIRHRSGTCTIVLWTGDALAPLMPKANELQVQLVQKGIGASAKLDAIAKAIVKSTRR